VTKAIDPQPIEHESVASHLMLPNIEVNASNQMDADRFQEKS